MWNNKMHLKINEHCFALGNQNMCRLLTIGRCPGHHKGCAFYKPMWMAKRDARRRLYRISEMPEEKQQRIADTYYGGEMPWRNIRWEE